MSGYGTRRSRERRGPGYRTTATATWAPAERLDSARRVMVSGDNLGNGLPPGNLQLKNGGNEAQVTNAMLAYQSAVSGSSGQQVVQNTEERLETVIKNNCVLGNGACFGAGTNLLSPNGPKAIEEFVVGDQITTRNEFEPDGPLEVKVVEERFVRTGKIFHLQVNGKVIRTTEEHPFWVDGKGWLRAGDLKKDDRLLGHDGQWVTVEEVYDTGEWETVYNLRISDYHTYFVSDWDWSFSVWAHNACVSFERVVSGSAGISFATFAWNYRQLQVRRTPEGSEERATWRTGGKNIAVSDVSRAPTQQGWVSRDYRDSEEWMIEGLRDQASIPGSGGHVNALFSEREPCGPSRRNCTQLIQNWLQPQTSPAAVICWYLVPSNASGADLLARYAALHIPNG